MFGRDRPKVNKNPTKVKKIEPYAIVKRRGLFKWEVTLHRGEDDDAYRYFRQDDVRYFNYTYYYLTEAKAERMARLLLARAKERILWSQTVTRFDVEQ